MDLDVAGQAHAQWKVKLRMAITKQESLDATSISLDNCCPLGKWLHGEARSQYGKLPAYRECVDRHATFHREAGAVATAINQKRYAQASQMLEAGTPYAAASSAVGSAILGLKKASATVA